MELLVTGGLLKQMTKAVLARALAEPPWIYGRAGWLTAAGSEVVVGVMV